VQEHELRGCLPDADAWAQVRNKLDQLVSRYAEAVSIRYVQREPGAIVIDFVKN
jgi:hypothetical protein